MREDLPVTPAQEAADPMLDAGPDAPVPERLSVETCEWPLGAEPGPHWMSAWRPRSSGGPVQVAVVPAEFARALEAERDQARAELADLEARIERGADKQHELGDGAIDRGDQEEDAAAHFHAEHLLRSLLDKEVDGEPA